MVLKSRGIWFIPRPSYRSYWNPVTSLKSNSTTSTTRSLHQDHLSFFPFHSISFPVRTRKLSCIWNQGNPFQQTSCSTLMYSTPGDRWQRKPKTHSSRNQCRDVGETRKIYLSWQPTIITPFRWPKRLKRDLVNDSFFFCRNWWPYSPCSRRRESTLDNWAGAHWKGEGWAVGYQT